MTNEATNRHVPTIPSALPTFKVTDFPRRHQAVANLPQVGTPGDPRDYSQRSAHKQRHYPEQEHQIRMVALQVRRRSNGGAMIESRGRRINLCGRGTEPVVVG